MFTVTFIDKNHGGITETFNEYAEAQEYWDSYADTDSCVYGRLEDENGVIWEFDETED